MRFTPFPKWLAFLGGLAILAMSAMFFHIVAIGTFVQGKAAAILCGVLLAFAALPLLALPISARLAKALLVHFLVVLSALMVIAAFNPPAAVSEPSVYQVAAIAFVVLVVARVVLAWRRKVAPARS